MTRQGPNRLTSIASATVPRSTLLAVAHRSYMVEALLTSTSARPNRPLTQSAMVATLTELSTSSWQATIRTPSGSSSLAASSPLRRSREPSTTPKPSRASWRHTSRPTPRLPPVTTATGMSKDTGTPSAGHDRDVSHGSHLAIRGGGHWLIPRSQLGETALRAARRSLRRRRGGGSGRGRGVRGRRGGGGSGRGVRRGRAGVVVGGELLQPVAEAAEHRVGRAPPDRTVQDHAALVEQHVIPEPLGLHLRDQHHQLVVLVLRLDVTEVLHDRLDDRAVVAAQPDQRDARVPLLPLVAPRLLCRLLVGIGEVHAHRADFVSDGQRGGDARGRQPGQRGDRHHDQRLVPDRRPRDLAYPEQPA